MTKTNTMYAFLTISSLLLMLTDRCMAGTQGIVQNLLNKTRVSVENAIRGAIDRDAAVNTICTELLEGQVSNLDPNIVLECDCFPSNVTQEIAMNFTCVADNFSVGDQFNGAANIQGDLKFDYYDKSLSFFSLALCIEGEVPIVPGLPSLPADGCVTADVKKNEEGNKYIDDCSGTIEVTDFPSSFTCGCSLCPGDGAIGINYLCETPLLAVPFAVPLCFSL